MDSSPELKYTSFILSELPHRMNLFEGSALYRCYLEREIQLSVVAAQILFYPTEEEILSSGRQHASRVSMTKGIKRGKGGFSTDTMKRAMHGLTPLLGRTNMKMLPLRGMWISEISFSSFMALDEYLRGSAL